MMNDDFVPIRIPSTVIARTSVLDFLPGQIAAGLLAGGRYGAEGDGPYLAARTVAICEAIVERLKQSPLWQPAVVIFPKAENTP